MKRTRRGAASKKRIKEIRCNRTQWRKKVIGRKGAVKFRRRGKSEEWENINEKIKTV